MRILMLGNSFIFTNDLPSHLAERTGAEVVSHTRGGARLSEQLNPETKMGSKTQQALQTEHWDYVVLQEMSNAPIKTPDSFYKSVRLLCEQARAAGAVPVLYATWAYQKDGPKMQAMGISYEEMYRGLTEAYHRAAEENNALVADVGTRFYERCAAGENLYLEDSFHPNLQGTQIAADTLAEVILGDAERRSR